MELLSVQTERPANFERGLKRKKREGKFKVQTGDNTRTYDKGTLITRKNTSLLVI